MRAVCGVPRVQQEVFASLSRSLLTARRCRLQCPPRLGESSLDLCRGGESGDVPFHEPFPRGGFVCVSLT